ncbi:MAG TPA: peptidylprolyl isomerase [Longimicrobiales bacterium]|nr:peptidylprolyl isomerase [Longimicrobiales bacterium]
MAQAKQGDTVHVHYTGRLDDGTVFDSSRERQPLEFTLGEGRVIPGFERAVTGMEPGENRTATIAAAEAYGPHRDDLVMTVGHDQLPDDLQPQVGQKLGMRTSEGRTMEVQITATDEDAVQLDANHPLAGRDLTFDIELVRIG